jgi:hypothetical protein
LFYPSTASLKNKYGGAVLLADYPVKQNLNSLKTISWGWGHYQCELLIHLFFESANKLRKARMPWLYTLFGTVSTLRGKIGLQEVKFVKKACQKFAGRLFNTMSHLL